MRLPPMRTSLQGGHTSLDGVGCSSDAGSSFTNSPCSSMGSITGFILAAQQHQGFSLQQMPRGGDAVSGAAAAAAGAGAAAGVAHERPGSSSSTSGVAAGGAVAEGAGGGALAVQASNAVSVSAISELQLQSSALRVSVGQQPAAAQRGKK